MHDSEDFSTFDGFSKARNKMRSLHDDPGISEDHRNNRRQCGRGWQPVINKIAGFSCVRQYVKRESLQNSNNNTKCSELFIVTFGQVKRISVRVSFSLVMLIFD